MLRLSRSIQRGQRGQRGIRVAQRRVNLRLKYRRHVPTPPVLLKSVQHAVMIDTPLLVERRMLREKLAAALCCV